MTQFGSRIIQTYWTEDQEDVAFLIAIKVVGVDKQGMLLDLMKIVSSRMQLNLRKVSIESMKGLFEGIFHLYVQDLGELDQVIHRLERHSNVHLVRRLENELPEDGEL
jgi:GTP diphosphokinase / guanosine-3',5'-bis(diphosphate) 3'-diphosphatase